jgi:hypothetical protein
MKTWCKLGGPVMAAAILGCAPALPTPEPPSGVGWYTRAQGYHVFTQSQSTQRAGRVQITTTSTTTGYVNARQNERRFADDVPRQIAAGHNVAEYVWNRGVAGEAAR